MLPNFLIIGAMKAGTTSLYEYLRGHPEVFMADPKELDFFLDAGNWHRGLDWYEAHFAGAGRAVAVGEASPNYAKAHLHPEVAQRIAATLPGVRLVYLVRDPVARIRSMYAHLAAGGMERRPFVRAVREDDDYVRTSMYAWQLRQFLAHVPPERVLVVTSRSLRHDREATVRRVLRFLGADPDRAPANLGTEAHRTADLSLPRPVAARLEGLGPYRRLLDRSWRLRRVHRRLTSRPATVPDTALPPDVEDELRHRLAEDVADLAQLTKVDVSPWGYG